MPDGRHRDTRIFKTDKAVHRFVGKPRQAPRTFILLGLFYPRRGIADCFQDELFPL
ncbi:hypothetical protein [Streptomyces sp. NPDC048436]|uniref:hypothetical protein n=1 Tax=Streptomyces sp. NPDC048436 TaxID=3365550 RepID=UPI00371F381A